MKLTISCDQGLLDMELVHAFLSEETSWARGIPRETLERALDYSLCFGMYEGERQIGFARVVTDHATFAYLCDVFILPSHRGRGLGRALMEAVQGHGELQGLRRWVLVTSTAADLYRKFGWTPVGEAQGFMQMHDPGVYSKDA